MKKFFSIWVVCTIASFAPARIVHAGDWGSASKPTPGTATLAREIIPPSPVDPGAAESHPDYILVGFKKGISAQNKLNAHASIGAERVRSFRRIAVDVVRVRKDRDREALIAAYRKRTDVAYAEPNYIVTKSTIPNDPDFGQLWGLRNTGQSGGTPGADIAVTNVWATHGTGSTNIMVAVIDTGIDYTHQDLTANIWINPGEIAGNTIDDDGNGIVDDIYGARWIDGTGLPTSGDPMDGNNHGTHVSGTIGGHGNNGVGVAGVNWRVRLMALKFLDDTGSGFTADAIAAIEYAIDKGAHLSNNSWGGGGYSQALKDAIDAAGAANQLFIAAAGNSASDNDASPSYPASYSSSNIIAVASSDRNDARSSFSSYGRTSVDIAAPGSAIYSSVPGDNYDTFNGTSMATPHVAGAAALLWSLHPAASHETVKKWMLQGAQPVPAWQGSILSGGRLHVSESARLAALPGSVAPMINFVAASQEGDHSISLAWTNPSTNLWFSAVIIRRATNAFPARWDAGEPAYTGTDEALDDSPLTVGQRYFYSGWAVYTNAGNTYYSAPAYAQSRVGGEPDDYFTEVFSGGDNDLAFTTLTLVTNGGLNRYQAFADPATAFPTDPSGGTPLILTDDNWVGVTVNGGQKVSLYRADYTNFFVGANGYLSFGTGDTEYTESAGSHFRIPRISALFDDLDPSSGGTVSWKQAPDRVAVTYENIPEFGNNNQNSYQIELFFDGTIRLTWLALDARDGLAGLSSGDGTPINFLESNLSDYPSIDPLRITPRTGFSTSGEAGGPFTPAGMNYLLTNAGPSSLSWSVAAKPGWVDVDPPTGTLSPGETALVILAVNTNAPLLDFGLYPSPVTFSNQLTGRTHTRPASLAVTRPGFTAIYFADAFAGSNFILPALQSRGYAVDEADSWEDFNLKLAATNATLAVALNQAGPPEMDIAALENHLQGGGRLLAADWSR
jgi:subtilisin family serine protease